MRNTAVFVACTSNAGAGSRPGRTAPIMQRILFICVRNSARSQMAAAFMRAMCSQDVEVESAGLEAGELNPLAVAAMHEIGIDISRNKTQRVFDLFKTGQRFSLVVTVCDKSNAERCPIFPGTVQRCHWSIQDPAALQGTWNEQLSATREIRDEIRGRVAALCTEYCTRTASS